MTIREEFLAKYEDVIPVLLDNRLLGSGDLKAAMLFDAVTTLLAVVPMECRWCASSTPPIQGYEYGEACFHILRSVYLKCPSTGIRDDCPLKEAKP